MKAAKTILIVIPVLIIGACSSSKKSASTAASTPPPVVFTNPSTSTLAFVKPADGIYPPGNEELTAIQAKHKEVTLEQLKEGHAIYTKGACVGCHGTASIYQYEESQWKYIIDDMALRANMPEAQKDAVYKYVLSIKATQSK